MIPVESPELNTAGLGNLYRLESVMGFPWAVCVRPLPKKEKTRMNLFDKIKDTFSNEDEKAAAAKAAADQGAADSLAAQNQAAVDAANAAAGAEAQAKAQAEAQARVAEQTRALEEAAAAEKAAADKAAADKAAADQAAAEAAAAAAAAAAKPAISVATVKVIVAHDSDPSVPTGVGANTEIGLIVEKALASVVGDTGPMDGCLGTSFTAAYSRFQESLGYSGSDADGVPGHASLQALAERTGTFTVVD